jgi:hypothetical protein
VQSTVIFAVTPIRKRIAIRYRDLAYRIYTYTVRDLSTLGLRGYHIRNDIGIGVKDSYTVYSTKDVSKIARLTMNDRAVTAR